MYWGISLHSKKWSFIQKIFQSPHFLIDMISTREMSSRFFWWFRRFEQPALYIVPSWERSSRDLPVRSTLLKRMKSVFDRRRCSLSRPCCLCRKKRQRKLSISEIIILYIHLLFSSSSSSLCVNRLSAKWRNEFIYHSFVLMIHNWTNHFHDSQSVHRLL